MEISRDIPRLFWSILEENRMFACAQRCIHLESLMKKVQELLFFLFFLSVRAFPLSLRTEEALYFVFLRSILIL